MLDEHELAIWYGRLGLSEPTQSLESSVQNHSSAQLIARHMMISNCRSRFRQSGGYGSITIRRI